MLALVRETTFCRFYQHGVGAFRKTLLLDSLEVNCHFGLAVVSPESPSTTPAAIAETALAPGSAASNSHPSAERLKRYLILLQAASF
jgi:hypothetical protein